MLFIHSSVDEHLGCFHLLAVVNNAAMNIGLLVSVEFLFSVLFGHTPKSGIAESYDNSV